MTAGRGMETQGPSGLGEHGASAETPSAAVPIVGYNGNEMGRKRSRKGVRMQGWPRDPVL